MLSVARYFMALPRAMPAPSIQANLRSWRGRGRVLATLRRNHGRRAGSFYWEDACKSTTATPLSLPSSPSFPLLPSHPLASLPPSYLPTSHPLPPLPPSPLHPCPLLLSLSNPSAPFFSTCSAKVHRHSTLTPSLCAELPPLSLLLKTRIALPPPRVPLGRLKESPLASPPYLTMCYTAGGGQCRGARKGRAKGSVSPAHP